MPISKDKKAILPFLAEHAGFTRLVLARVISVLGDQIHTVTNMLLVQKLTGSSLALGAVFIANTIPRIVFSMLGGVTVDRYDRKKIMILCDLIRTVSVLGLVLLAAIGQINIVYIAGFAALNGVAAAFYLTAVRTTIPFIVEKEKLQQANAIYELGVRFASILGSTLGGVIFALWGPWAGYGLDALTYLISAALILGIALQWAQPSAAEGEARKTGLLWKDLKEGWAFIFSQEYLVALVGLSIVIPFISLPVAQLLPAFAEKNLGAASPALFGILWSGVTIGLTLGAFAMNLVGQIRRKGLAIWLSVLLMGVGAVSIGMTHQYVVALLAIIAIGFCISWSGILLITTYQTSVPKEMLGRFLGNVGLFDLALQPVVIAAAGFLADRFGAGRVLYLAGAGVAVFCGLWLVKFRPILFTGGESAAPNLAPGGPD